MKKSLGILSIILLMLSVLLPGCSGETAQNIEKLELKDFYIFLVEDIPERRPVAKITVNTTFTEAGQQKELQDLLDKGGRRALGEMILKDYLEEYIPAQFDGVSYPVQYMDYVKDITVTRHELNWNKTVTLLREFRLDGLSFDHTVEIKAAVPVVNDKYDDHTSSEYINDDLPYLDGRLTMASGGGTLSVAQDGSAYIYEANYSFMDRIQADFGYYEITVYGAPTTLTCTIDE